MEEINIAELYTDLIIKDVRKFEDIPSDHLKELVKQNLIDKEMGHLAK